MEQLFFFVLESLFNRAKKVFYIVPSQFLAEDSKNCSAQCKTSNGFSIDQILQLYPHDLMARALSTFGQIDLHLLI
jgi:hypothetical protein